MRNPALPLIAILAAFGCGGQSPLDPSPTDNARRQQERRSEQAADRPEKEKAPAADPKAAVAGLVAASNGFGLQIYAQARSSQGNLALSPASLGVGLGMLWGGARGETATAMGAVLGFDGTPAALAIGWGQLSSALQSPEAPFTFRLANRLFGDAGYDFEPGFVETSRAVWGAPLETLPFRDSPEEARQAVNAWVEEQTEQRIRDLIPPNGVSKDTRLVLANAIYFLGDWLRPFEEAATRDAPFHATPETTVQVPTMQQLASFRLAELDGVSVLELPYAGERLAMLVALPKALDGLAALEADLSAPVVEAWRDALAPAEVSVGLPRFEVDPPAALSLAETLRGLGLGVAFDPQRADFTGIADPPSPDERLVLDEVFHKAFVEVDEAGTEAAAGTAVAMVRAAALPTAPPKEFRADHPFLFFIVEQETGLILFAGRVVEP